MCFGCWVEYGSPTIRNDRTLAAVDLIGAVYEHSCVGGNLHVQLDDWNIEDEFFEGDMTVYKCHEATPEQLAAERACYAAFKAMSLAERASALAFYSRFGAP